MRATWSDETETNLGTLAIAQLPAEKLLGATTGAQVESLGSYRALDLFLHESSDNIHVDQGASLLRLSLADLAPMT
jgi:hypothetical protein